MVPGIDISVMAHLKKKAEILTAQNKICVLLFDEIALKKRLIYNGATDEVDGFEDLGGQGERSEKIANHALVLMLQGIHKKIKQPIAHYFVKGTITTQKLVIIIKTAIRAVTETGYKVLATVCDQGPTNVGAINLLKKLSGEPVGSNYFLVDDEKVFIIYDVPHLFKSLRNNFLEGGLLKMNNKTAKWSHLVELQEKNQSTLHFTKITKSHVSPKYRTKMKVKLAAQILSNTTAAILKLLAESVEIKEKNKEILETAHIVEDLDRLFDCTNGPSSHKDIKKGIRQNVTKNSYHHECWIEYKKKLKTLLFPQIEQPT
ncbi:uncharacterized protein LOC134661705 [Cydia amplana]|uniref:uncharacterized protein LOC134661705 n=1 Tax=Cydia amplana TaxID=1869771 RepID=UPI002FE6A821